MRDIKFRVWDILNKRILNYGEIMTLPMWEVLPGTPEQRAFNAMQYTGLKDKNSTEIYEGDIVDIGNGEIFVVDWHKYDKEFTFSKEGYYYPRTYRRSTRERWIVIGNIYENPELLEGNKNG